MCLKKKKLFQTYAILQWRNQNYNKKHFSLKFLVAIVLLPGPHFYTGRQEDTGPQAPETRGFQSLLHPETDFIQLTEKGLVYKQKGSYNQKLFALQNNCITANSSMNMLHIGTCIRENDNVFYKAESALYLLRNSAHRRLNSALSPISETLSRFTIAFCPFLLIFCTYPFSLPKPFWSILLPLMNPAMPSRDTWL